MLMQINREEISTQEIEDYSISDLLYLDYPPRLEIVIQSVPNSSDAGPLRVHIKGLDRESTFSLPPSMTHNDHCIYYVVWYFFTVKIFRLLAPLTKLNHPGN